MCMWGNRYVAWIQTPVETWIIKSPGIGIAGEPSIVSARNWTQEQEVPSFQLQGLFKKENVGGDKLSSPQAFIASTLFIS